MFIEIYLRKELLQYPAVSYKLLFLFYSLTDSYRLLKIEKCYTMLFLHVRNGSDRRLPTELTPGDGLVTSRSWIEQIQRSNRLLLRRYRLDTSSRAWRSPMTVPWSSTPGKRTSPSSALSTRWGLAYRTIEKEKIIWFKYSECITLFFV